MENSHFLILITYFSLENNKVRKLSLTPEEYFDDYDPDEVYSVNSTPKYIQLVEYIDGDPSKIKTIDLYIFNRLNDSALSLKKLHFSSKNWFSVRKHIEKGVVVFSEYMTELFDLHGETSQIIKLDENEGESLQLISHALIRERENHPDEIIDLKNQNK